MTTRSAGDDDCEPVDESSGVTLAVALGAQGGGWCLEVSLTAARAWGDPVLHVALSRRSLPCAWRRLRAVPRLAGGPYAGILVPETSRRSDAFRSTLRTHGACSQTSSGRPRRRSSSIRNASLPCRRLWQRRIRSESPWNELPVPWATKSPNATTAASCCSLGDVVRRSDVAEPELDTGSAAATLVSSDGSTSEVRVDLRQLLVGFTDYGTVTLDVRHLVSSRRRAPPRTCSRCGCAAPVSAPGEVLPKRRNPSVGRRRRGG